MILLFAEQVETLEEQTVELVQCGNSHSVAVTDTGQLFTWGDNSYGQLGRGYTDDTYSQIPK